MLGWLWKSLRGRSAMARGLDVIEGVFRPTASAARHDLESQHEVRVEAPAPDDAFLGERAISIRRARPGTRPGDDASK